MRLQVYADISQSRVCTYKKGPIFLVARSF